MNSSPLVPNVQNKGHVFKLTLKEPAKTNEDLGIFVLREEKEKALCIKSRPILSRSLELEFSLDFFQKRLPPRKILAEVLA